ncbi:MAG: hypothetical protein DCE90_13670 [Pseudanabaena sp.]|nr:MAG: hypothetical protein DCE90_13670 [Pseudanabaena sp.]
MKFRTTENLTTKKLIFNSLVNVIASSVALGFSSSGAIAIGLQITSITTTTTNGTNTSTSATSTNPAPSLDPGVPYTVNFSEDTRAITTITTASGVYSAASAIPLTVFTRRNSAAASGVNNTNSDIFYSPGTANNTTDTITVNSINPFSLTQAQVLGRNDINLGSDNLFTNSGNVINNNNIERLDFISAAAGFTASNLLAFSIIERGNAGANDSFKIAAITSLAGGLPSGYGTLFTVGSGDYGAALDTFTSVGFKDDQPSAFNGSQDLRGLLIRPTTDLGIASGATIFGFSIFAADTTGTGTQLVDVTNTSFFPTTTPDGSGGLDLIAGNVGVVAVPFDFNPQLGVVILGGAWFVRRQLKKKAAK